MTFILLTLQPSNIKRNIV